MYEMRIHYATGYRVYFIAKSLGVVARARGMSQLAKDTGLGRESLNKALSGESNPSFATIMKIMHALGLKIQVSQASCA